MQIKLETNSNKVQTIFSNKEFTNNTNTSRSTILLNIYISKTLVLKTANIFLLI